MNGPWCSAVTPSPAAWQYSARCRSSTDMCTGDKRPSFCEHSFRRANRTGDQLLSLNIYTSRPVRKCPLMPLWVFVRLAVAECTLWRRAWRQAG
jgi:hypothetical protein